LWLLKHKILRSPGPEVWYKKMFVAWNICSWNKQKLTPPSCFSFREVYVMYVAWHKS
jgi:hypothetical protein